MIKINDFEFEVEGVTLISYDGEIKKEIKDEGVSVLLYPESKYFTSKKLVDYAKEIVAEGKKGNKIIVVTNNPFFIRGIEVYSDLMNTMDNLNVYTLRMHNNSLSLNNLSYSEYGMSSLYEEISEVLNEMDGLLDKKYGF